MDDEIGGGGGDDEDEDEDDDDDDDDDGGGGGGGDDDDEDGDDDDCVYSHGIVGLVNNYEEKLLFRHYLNHVLTQQRALSLFINCVCFSSKLSSPREFAPLTFILTFTI